MSSPWIASLIAIFVWWFSTGAILVAVRRADRLGSHGMTVFMGLPLLVVGMWAVGASLTDASVVGAYIGFAGALAIWGWIELAFLAGVITGPQRDECPPGLVLRDRFFRAFQAVAYHELALTLGLWGLVVASNGADNRVALATYLVLFVARILAKLNLFFGVPRINLEFVPDRLLHLKSYFRHGPVTLAFPFAITVLTALLAVCAERLWTAGADVMVVGYALLTAMAALALLEHWLMVVPLPDAKLWRWMLPAPKR
ncbi:putative photosynthetic complex assembly protein PuhE [Yoonia sp.]|uniref:putative photosynthetic complex assembly protein PuhE n=1 Tax=Yoonia sp. TaxID=2212373 RepID=UPI0023B3CA29